MHTTSELMTLRLAWDIAWRRYAVKGRGASLQGHGPRPVVLKMQGMRQT